MLLKSKLHNHYAKEKIIENCFLNLKPTNHETKILIHIISFF